MKQVYLMMPPDDVTSAPLSQKQALKLDVAYVTLVPFDYIMGSLSKLTSQNLTNINHILYHTLMYFRNVSN